MNIKEISKAIMVPRFSTEEIEGSKLRGGLSFRSTTLFFDDLKPGLPTLVLGYVTTKKKNSIHATWNKYGECFVQRKRIKSFDLIRPTQREIDSQKTFGEALLVGVIVIIICIIF